MSIRSKKPQTTKKKPQSLTNNKTPPSYLSQTLAITANLSNLLPTGTLLAFQLLIPSFTNNGHCDSSTRFITISLLILLSSSAFLACFTDSFQLTSTRVIYGLATPNGMWMFDPPLDPVPDLKKYRIRFIDWLHGVLSVLVFVAVALRDNNVVRCFYPMAGRESREILDVVPVGIGVICGLVFAVFPTTRHGIGYPVNSNL